jgi:hypothetical protein
MMFAAVFGIPGLVGLLMMAAMVGGLAGCGGGGGGGSKPAPAPVAPDKQIQWQTTAFTTAVAPAEVRSVASILLSPGGRVHVAWQTWSTDPVSKLANDFQTFISRSDDGGASWSSVKLDNVYGPAKLLRLSTGMLVTGVDVSPHLGDVPEGGGFSVWTSVDDGATWQPRRLALPLRNGLPAPALNEVSAMAERNGEVVLVRGRGVVDRRATPAEPRATVYVWNPLTEAVADWSFAYDNEVEGSATNGVAVAADGTVFVGYNDVSSVMFRPGNATVFRSGNGVTWEELAPFTSYRGEVSDLALLSDGMLLLSVNGNVRRSADGRTWLEPDGVYAHGVRVHELASGALFSEQGYSCDWGASWQESATSVGEVLVQAADGTLWSTVSTNGAFGEVVKAVPPAGVAARDFVRCP